MGLVDLNQVLIITKSTNWYSCYEITYAIIIDKKWTMCTYVTLVLKDSTTYILYKSPHICEELVYLFKYL